MMLEFLMGKASDRKSRLFAVACCRSIWSFLADERSRNAVEAAERRANEEVSAEELERVRYDAGKAFQAAITPLCRDAQSPRTAPCAGARAAVLALLPNALEAAARTASQAVNAARRAPGVSYFAAYEAALLPQAVSMRDIFGNPFRPITFDPAWRTTDVLALARGIYAERAFDRMPILADALQDAGCDNEDVLNHCRGDGPHVRGCWVVDLVMGKE
jgi:hypothetical protein